MINITLPDGSQREFPGPVTVAEVAASIGAGLAKARWATLRRKLINVPARVAATGRRLVLHLPTHWPWADAWWSLHAVATGPPQPAAP